MGSQKIFSFILVGIITIGLAASGAGAAPRTEPTPGGSITVNDGYDSYHIDIYISLREAVDIANGTLTGEFTDAEKTLLNGCTFTGSTDNWYISGGCGLGIVDEIVFAAALTLVDLNNPLNPLTDAGTSIRGVGGLPGIDANEMSGGNVFNIAGDSIAIQGLSIYNTPADYADIQVSDGKGSTIENNRLGLAPTGTCLDVMRGGANGIKVTTEDGVDGTGTGSAYIFHNTIGCHSKDGILVQGSDYTRIGLNPALVMNPNYIGIDVNDNALPNGQNGIRVEPLGVDQSTHTSIIANVIGNNQNSGVLINETSNTNVLSNTIGANRYGLVAAPNEYDGVRINGDASDLNMIQFNTISSNLQSGVKIEGGDNNYVLDNKIGINSTSNGSLPNVQDGIGLYNNANQNYIGVETSLAAPENLITHVQRIGHNHYAGIYIYNSDQNYIGALNLIYRNGNGGVVVADANSTGNRITPLGVIDNGGLPIDLGEDGATLNDLGDSDTGANTLLNYPEVVAFTETLLVGHSCANCYVYFYVAYANPGEKFGGGELLGYTTAVGNDWIVDLSTFPGGAGLTAKDISMVAVQPGLESNTSEMSPRTLLFLPALINP